MADASYQQTSFLGGEWSPQAQGRAEDPRYKTGMNVSLNGYPIEEGAWVKRSGFRDIGPTYHGEPARFLPLSLSVELPYEVEITQDKVRIWAGDRLVQDSVANIINVTNTTPPILTVDEGGASWQSDDVIVITLTGGDPTALGGIQNQQVRLNKLASQTYNLADPITGAGLDGSLFHWDALVDTGVAGHVLTEASPWGADYVDVNNTTFNDTIFFFHVNHPPQAITWTPNPQTPFSVGIFTFGAAPFEDGPYFDWVDGSAPGTQAQTATVGGTSNPVTVTFVNGFGPYQAALRSGSAEVGRIIRILNQPLDWDGSTVYSGGANVLFNGLPYTALATTTAGDPPNLSPQEWYPNTQAQLWFYGTIQSVLGPTQATVAFAAPTGLLYATTIRTWRLGKFGDPTVQYPRTGAIHETRLWVDWNNSVNASQPGLPYLFQPTLGDGTVTDASGIAYTIESGDQDANTVNWMISDLTGLLVATNAGEWVVKASTLDDPVTAFSIQARRVTKYSSKAAARPVKTPLAIVFVQRYGRKVMEFLADVFSGKYVAPNLTAMARHLTASGVKQLAYQEEVTPIIWGISGSGLIGATYRRNSAFITEAPAFTGWHRHTHGSGRIPTQLLVVPSAGDATTDSLYTINTDGSYYRLQRLTKQYGEEDTMLSSWFLDYGIVPTAMVDMTTFVRLYGLLPFANLGANIVLAGLSIGSLGVSAQGTVDVPYTTTLTAASIAALNGGNFGEAGTGFTSITSTTPTRSPTPTTIGNYMNSTLPHSGTVTNTVVIPDFANNHFITVSLDSGTANSAEIRSYNLTTRAAVASVQASASLFSGPTQVFGGGAMTSDGALMLQMDNNSASILQKIDPATMTSLATFGSSGSGFSPFLLEYSRGMATTYAGGNYLVSVGSQTGNVQVINADTMLLAGVPATGLGATFVTRGSTTGTQGSVFLLDGQPSITAITSALIHEVVVGAAASTWFLNAELGLWNTLAPYIAGESVYYNGSQYTAHASTTGNNPQTDAGGSSTYWTLDPNPHLQVISRGTLNVGAIDPAWTGFFVQDMGYDRSDGTLIVAVTAGNSPTHPNRLVKVRPTDGSVVWSVAIAGGVTIPGLKNARIQGERFGYIDASGTVYAIDAGSIATSFVTHAAPAGAGQLVDSQNGYLYALFNYNSGTTGAPTQLSGTPGTFNEWAVYTPGTELTANSSSVSTTGAPCVVGFPYTAQGQTLRPLSNQDSGARNGPALGKTRRTHMFGALLRESQAVQFGSDFIKMRAAQFKTPGGLPYAASELWSGVYWDTLEGDYNFDGMLAWRSMDPYPLTVVSVSGFLHTQDR